MNVLITGAAGLIGNAILQECKSRNWNITAIDNNFKNQFIDLDNDIIDIDTVSYIKDRPQCIYDIIFHMSAINGTDYFYDRPNTVLHNNVVSDLAILNFVEYPCRLVYASSSEVVSGNSVPTAEDTDITIENIHNPRWSYRLGKILTENYLANSRLDYVTIRYFNVFGDRSSKGHFFYDMVYKLAKGDHSLIGGFETRSFCYVKDAAKATVDLALLKYRGVVNVGNPEELMIVTAANMVAEQWGYGNIDWKLLPGRQGSTTRRAVDIAKLKSLCPDFNPMKFQDAIKEIYLTITK